MCGDLHSFLRNSFWRDLGVFAWRKITNGQKFRNHSITNATFCLAQPNQVNMGLKTIFGSSNIYLDQVLVNKIFLISKIICQDIIRLRCVSDGMQNFITFAPLSYDIWKIYFAYQKYFVGQNLVQVYVWTAKYRF